MKIHDEEYNDLCTLQEIMYTLNLDMSERSDLEDLKKEITKINAIADKLLSLNDKDMKDKVAEFDKLYFQNGYDD